MTSVSNYKSFINYLFIFLAINYNLLVKFVVKIDYTGYGLIFLSLIVFLTNFSAIQRLQSKKPIVFWLIWCIFALINYYLHPHYTTISIITLYRKIFIPLILMTIVVYEYKRNSSKLIWICFYTHIIYLLLGCYFDTGILYRDIIEDNELGNAYATISSFSFFYLAILNNLKRINTPLFLIILLAIFLVLAMSGTRKAFGSGVILFTFWVISQLKFKSIRSWFWVGLFIAGGLWGYNYLIEHTYMGYRMEVLDAQQEEYIYGNIPGFLSILGDRAPLYYFGFLIFMSNPVLGVGLSQANVEGAYIHSEYVVQLAENGIVGFALFVSLYYWIFKKIAKRIKYDKKVGLSMLGGLVAMLFLFVTAWAWEFPQYFICAGVLIGYSLNQNENLVSQ